jgi:hypothetical protein
MKKTTTPTPNPWNDSVEDNTPEPELLPEPEPEVIAQVASPQVPVTLEYSLEGLKADFPSAKELEQFVFDETSVSLRLKGIDPERKYELALAVLQNEDIDPKYITGANPYVDNKELIPEDPIREVPKRDPRLPQAEPVNVFHDFNMPHPDPEMLAQDAKVKCAFKLYEDGSISYEILGPLEKHAIGEKLDKYGRSRPEKMVWVDPRTGEQAVRLRDGTFTKMGRRLKTVMETRRVNKTKSVWNTWIDRDFAVFNQDAVDNPWK